MEEQGFAILMLLFGGMILLYALILIATGDDTMIPRHYATRPKDKKAYARRVGKITALVSLAPLLSGLTGLLSPVLGLVVFGVGLAFFLWLGVRLFP